MIKKIILVVTLLSCNSILPIEEKTNSELSKKALFAGKLFASMMVGGVTGSIAGYTNIAALNQMQKDPFFIRVFMSPLLTLQISLVEWVTRAEIINRLADKPWGIKAVSPERFVLGYVAQISSWLGFIGTIYNQLYR